MPVELKRQHREACFARAFPRSRSERNEAHRQLLHFDEILSGLSKKQGADLADTGIAGTKIRYCFSFEVARWLARSSPGAVTIDWPELTDSEALDDLLRQVLQPSEDEYFDSGYVDTREWVELASAACAGTDFDWLLAQLGEKRFEAVWRQLYDAAEIPLVWDLTQSRYSISRNTFAMASLAARHRETYHFNFANPDEVYLADVGEGVAVAVFGLQAAHRFPLECTMGYLILSNGIPIGYGGASLLFKQVNTGINIFDDYRGSEAACLWVQVMRAYHSLVGCTRFVANAYQLGQDNSEALQSGAFWFYYHLGYRPVRREIRELAAAEMDKRRRDRSYRSGRRILKQLASVDMHLTLPGSRRSEFFDEEWLPTLSKLATRTLGQVNARTRQESVDSLTTIFARDLRIRSLNLWTANERRSLKAIAPLLVSGNPESWSDSTKQVARKILRAKGGQYELNFARLLCDDSQLLAYCRAACQREEGLRVSAPR